MSLYHRFPFMSILFHLFLYIITYNHRYLFDKTFYTKIKENYPKILLRHALFYLLHLFFLFGITVCLFQKDPPLISAATSPTVHSEYPSVHHEHNREYHPARFWYIHICHSGTQWSTYQNRSLYIYHIASAPPDLSSGHIRRELHGIP